MNGYLFDQELSEQTTAILVKNCVNEGWRFQEFIMGGKLDNVCKFSFVPMPFSENYCHDERSCSPCTPSKTSASTPSTPTPIDLCLNVDCGPSGTCDPMTGYCLYIDLCQGVDCGPSGSCDPMTGFCLYFDLCLDVDCGQSGMCDSMTGECIYPDLCLEVDCGPEGTCDKLTGECIYLCADVDCGYYGNCDPKTGKCDRCTGHAVAMGDTHYHSFDGVITDFQGHCQYQLTGICEGMGQASEDTPYFMITGRQQPKADYTENLHVTWLYGWTMKWQSPKQSGADNFITLRHEKTENEKQVFIDFVEGNDGEQILKPNHFYKQHQILTVDQNIYFGIIGEEEAKRPEKHFKVKLYWEPGPWGFVLHVDLDCAYRKHVCGLMGTFDGDQTNDWMLPDLSVMERPQISNKPRTEEMWVKTFEFGNQWLVGQDECPDDLKYMDAFKECSASLLNEIESDAWCGRLKNEPFAKCDLDVEPVFDMCVFDLCSIDKVDWEPAMCDLLSGQAQKCRGYGQPVGKWRTENFCPPKCDANMIWEDNATACPTTTNNCQPHNQINVCTLQTVSKCICQDSHPYWDDETQKCVAECPCRDPTYDIWKGEGHEGTITYFVDIATGKDEDSPYWGQSETEAYQTIRKALARIPEHCKFVRTVIYVKNGDYPNEGYGTGAPSNGGQELSTAASINQLNHVKLLNFPDHHPVIPFDGKSGISINKSKHIVVSGFEIIGPAEQTNKDEAMAHRLIDRHSFFQGRGIIGYNNINVRIRNNKVHHCNGGGIILKSSLDTFIDDNQVFENLRYTNNPESAVMLVGTSDDFTPEEIGDATPQTLRWRVSNNQVYNNWKLIPFWSSNYDDQNWVNKNKEDMFYPRPGYGSKSAEFIEHGDGIHTRCDDTNGRFEISENKVYRNGINGISVYRARANTNIFNNVVYRNGRTPKTEPELRDNNAGMKINCYGPIRFYENKVMANNAADNIVQINEFDNCKINVLASKDNRVCMGGVNDNAVGLVIRQAEPACKEYDVYNNFA